MTLVDTNVLLDVLADDPRWSEWSLRQLAQRAAMGPVIINEIVYAEMSARMENQAEVERALADFACASIACRCARFFSPAKAIAVTGRPVAFAPECYPTSSSAPMRRCWAARCSPVTCGATGRIFPMSRSLCRRRDSAI